MSIERQAMTGLTRPGTARFFSQGVSSVVTLMYVAGAVYLPCLALLNRQMWTGLQPLVIAVRASG